MDAEARWDPEMLAVQKVYELEAAKHPPVTLTPPLDSHRKVHQLLNSTVGVGEPTMALTTDRWVWTRGRHVLCRVHLPRVDALLPAVVYMHGGGWVWASVNTHDRLTREYAAGGDVALVVVDYSLAPETKFPGAIEECAAIVRHLAEHGREWGIDPARIAVAGDSSGGNLAFATALLLRDQGGPPLKGIMTAYPVCDNDFTRPSYKEFGTGYKLTADGMKAYWNVYLPHDVDRSHPLAAPLRAHLDGLPPVLIQLAELDPLRSEGEEMARRLKAAGVGCDLEIYPGMIHGFVRNTTTVGRAREAMASAGKWLRRTMA